MPRHTGLSRKGFGDQRHGRIGRDDPDCGAEKDDERRGQRQTSNDLAGPEAEGLQHPDGREVLVDRPADPESDRHENDQGHHKGEEHQTEGVEHRAGHGHDLNSIPVPHPAAVAGAGGSAQSRGQVRRDRRDLFAIGNLGLEEGQPVGRRAGVAQGNVLVVREAEPGGTHRDESQVDVFEEAGDMEGAGQSGRRCHREGVADAIVAGRTKKVGQIDRVLDRGITTIEDLGAPQGGLLIKIDIDQVRRGGARPQAEGGSLGEHRHRIDLRDTGIRSQVCLRSRRLGRGRQQHNLGCVETFGLTADQLGIADAAQGAEVEQRAGDKAQERYDSQLHSCAAQIAQREHPEGGRRPDRHRHHPISSRNPVSRERRS